MQVGLAFRAFWRCLTDAETADKVALAIRTDGPALPAPASTSPAQPETKPAKPAAPAAPAQNPAVTLLAALQREARLIDLVHENLDQYGDAQIGAAARPCLKQCRETLERLLQIRPLESASENETIQLPENASPGRYRWLGEPADGATTAKLIHPGWQAAEVDLPRWSGPPEEASVLAPAQLQSAS